MVDLPACKTHHGEDAMSGRRWIDPHDFADLRKQSGLTRVQAAEALDVTRRTIQNWETGGARIPWMAYRMLRILRGYALPGVSWEGWTMRNHQLFSPTGRPFDAVWLQNNEHVFAQAKLFRQMYAASGRAKTASTVVPFPDVRRKPEEAHRPPQAHQRKVGER
jgi:DNA-binding XRE family transcriptional regulator